MDVNNDALRVHSYVLLVARSNKQLPKCVVRMLKRLVTRLLAGRPVGGKILGRLGHCMFFLDIPPNYSLPLPLRGQVGEMGRDCKCILKNYCNTVL